MRGLLAAIVTMAAIHATVRVPLVWLAGSVRRRVASHWPRACLKQMSEATCVSQAATGTSADAVAMPKCEWKDVTAAGAFFECHAGMHLEGTRWEIRTEDMCGRTAAVSIPDDTSRDCVSRTFLARPESCEASGLDQQLGARMYTLGGDIELDTNGYGSVKVPRRPTSTVLHRVRWRGDASFSLRHSAQA